MRRYPCAGGARRGAKRSCGDRRSDLQPDVDPAAIADHLHSRLRRRARAADRRAVPRADVWGSPAAGSRGLDRSGVSRPQTALSVCMVMDCKVYQAGDVQLQKGGVLDGAQLAYQIYGRLADDKGNLVVLCTPFG